jgi:hypothetical protein
MRHGWRSLYLKAAAHSKQSRRDYDDSPCIFMILTSVVSAVILFFSFPIFKAVANDSVSCTNGVYNYYKIWGPPGAHYARWAVNKWKQPIRYVINDFTGDSEPSRALSKEVAMNMPKFAKATSLDIESDPEKGNVLIVITNDMPGTDTEISDAVRALYMRAGYGPNTEIMLKAHHELIDNMSPHCGGVVVGNNKDGIIGAFLYLSIGQNKNCVTTALSQMLAIGYDWSVALGESATAGDLNAIENEALSAAHELYDSAFEQGMKNDDVISIMGKKCQ